jgi:membrane protein YqaA with SNARE-associated domain
MIAALVTTAAVALASAFVPAIPIEAYLVAAIATTGTDPVALGVAAGLGQTAGKLLTFLAARGVIRSSRLKRSLGRRAGPLAESPAGLPGSGSAEGASPLSIWARTRRRIAVARERLAATLGRAVPPALGRWSRAAARSANAVSKRLIVLLDRPLVAAPTVFLSALLGVPPLLLTSVYAAGTHMSAATFGAVCFVGRSIRFIAIALVPQLVMN